MWCIPEVNEQFKKKMMDVLEVYEREYNPEVPVICLDEKNKQLLNRSRSCKNCIVGGVRIKDYEYVRNGSVNMFIMIEPKNKKRLVMITKRRRRKEFARAIKYLCDVHYKKCKKIVLVMDNLNTHNKKSLIREFGEKEGNRLNNKIEWHFTPKHASWLNMAELEISSLETQLLSKKDIPTFHQMQSEIFALVKQRNREKRGINWKYTREKARKTFKIPHT